MKLQTTDLIDLKKYPINKSNQQKRKLLKQIHADLEKNGCAVLKNFLTTKAIKLITIEANKVSHLGHRSFNKTNPYFTKDDISLPKDDPRRQFYKRSNNFISADNFSKKSTLRTIFDFPYFDSFIKYCVRGENFYRYADPLADVIINMAEEGNGFPWHFDTNDFTVTIAIQNAENGGEFQYVPKIRNKDENFEEVKKVLNGSSKKIISIELQPGDLQIFFGRNSIHRVAPLIGKKPRYVAIFSYVGEPGMIGSPERTKQLYGKTLPIHHSQSILRKDGLID